MNLIWVMPTKGESEATRIVVDEQLTKLLLIMLRTTFVALLLMAATCVFSQTIVSGIITDSETNKALAGATVSSSDGTIGTVSDELGNYSITIATNKEQVIVVQHVGYKTQTIKLIQSGTLNIPLKIGEYLEEVVIKSVRADAKAPVSQTTLSRKEIKEVYKGEHPIYFLSTLTPGILTESESGTSFGNYGTMRLRGIEQKRINFTLNGIPLNDMIDHGVYFSNFTDISNSFESVQVQRGVGTSTNGAASYGGSVNFESINLEKHPAGSTIQLGYGSYNSSRLNGQFNTGMLNNKWAFHGNFSRLYSDGYQDNTETNAYSFFFSGAYFGKKDVVKINAFDTRSRNGLGYAAVPKDILKDNPTFNPLDETDKDDFGQQFVQLQHIHTFTNDFNLVSSLYFNGAGGDYFWGERDDTTNFLTQYNYPLTNQHFGFMSQAHYSGITNLNISGGVHLYTFRRNNIESVSPDFANPYYDEHSRKDEASAFVKANYKLGNFNIYGDVDARVSTLTIMPDFDIMGIAKDEDLSKTWQFINPKVGVSYELDDYTLLYASIGKTSREPTKTDILGGWGLYDSTSYANLKNGIDFDHEQVIDIETGVRYNAPQFRGEINGFYMKFTDGILPTGETIEFGSQVRTNIPDSYRAGAEMLVQYNPITRLVITANASYTHSRIPEIHFTGDTVASKNIVPVFSPDIIANGLIEYGITKNIKLGISGRYVSESYMTLRNESKFKLPNHFLINSHVQINFLKTNSFRLEINNITSEKYYTKGEALGDVAGYLVNAPINVFGTLTLRFQ